MNNLRFFILAGILILNSHATKAQTGAGFIPLDSANKMITSYLNSISSGSSDPDLHSVIFNADSLRRILDDETNGRITNVKIILAHRLDYINGGGANTPCGYKSSGLTLVIAGFDENNNYIFYPAAKALNIGRPCPPSCPSTGTAVNDLLTTQ